MIQFIFLIDNLNKICMEKLDTHTYMILISYGIICLLNSRICFMCKKLFFNNINITIHSTIDNELIQKKKLLRFYKYTKIRF